MRYRIQPRPPEVANEPRNINVVQKCFNLVAEEINFHLYSSDFDPTSGIRSSFNAVAETSFQYREPTTIWFSFATLEPLLSSKITAAERMLCHFRIASTSIHEFSVCLQTRRDFCYSLPIVKRADQAACYVGEETVAN